MDSIFLSDNSDKVTKIKHFTIGFVIFATTFSIKLFYHDKKSNTTQTKRNY